MDMLPLQHFRRQKVIVFCLFLLTLLLSLVFLFLGSSQMSLQDSLQALLRKGSPAQERILWNIRIPRVLAALIAGCGLSLSGLIMQTVLNNPMASPATLGVADAAVFGANLSIIAFAGGFLSTGSNVQNYASGANPYATSLTAFSFAALSSLVILGLCKFRAFSPGVVVLAGIAVGSVWTAATTILQFYATDVGLSAAVIWNFGDLGRATYKTDLIMASVVLCGLVLFQLLAWHYNAMLSGAVTARSMGIPVELLRFLSMFFASLITAVCVSFLGIIGFVGIICPHAARKLLGSDHRILIPASALLGSLLILLADTLSRSLGNGSALPVGAITSLLGAPFFVSLIFSGKDRSLC